MRMGGDKKGFVFDVACYGAKGDGITKDTAAILQIMERIPTTTVTGMRKSWTGAFPDFA